MPEPQKSVISRLASVAVQIGVLSAALMTVLGFLWSGFRDDLTESTAGMLGVDVLVETMTAGFDRINAALEEQTALIEHNAARIEANHPTGVAVYDPVRSRVYSPCGRGDACAGQFRVRRTALGAACGAPEVLQRVVIDAAGVEHPVESVDSPEPSRISGGWTWIYPRFRVPRHAPLGVAEYGIRLLYECPWGQVEEMTERLRFEIVAGVDE